MSKTIKTDEFVFTDEFANNWVRDQEVTVVIQEDETKVLVDEVAIIEMEELRKHGYFRSERNLEEEYRVQALAEVMSDNYGWMLMSKMGNTSSGLPYKYNYVDKDGISITIDPHTKEFNFNYIVDHIFTLTIPNNYSPFDHKNGEFFLNTYLRFRKNVLSIGVNV